MHSPALVESIVMRVGCRQSKQDVEIAQRACFGGDPQTETVTVCRDVRGDQSTRHALHAGAGLTRL